MTDLISRMIKEAHSVLSNAYAPYSKYQVASSLCTENGNLYKGVNVENASFGLTLCAEASAICNMVSAGENKIKSMVILNGLDTLCAPCGACRQRIIEFADENTMIYLCNANTVIKSLTINELLPYAFRFKP